VSGLARVLAEGAGGRPFSCLVSEERNTLFARSLDFHNFLTWKTMAIQVTQLILIQNPS